MTFVSDAADFYNTPYLLSDGQRQDPLAVMTSFFIDIRLSEVKEFFDDAQRVCLTTNDFPYAEPDKRDEFMVYRSKIELLIHAAFVIVASNDKSAKP